MAFEDNKNGDNDSTEVNDSNWSHAELLDAFEDLRDDWKPRVKRIVLKNDYILLSKENEELQNENNVLKRNSDELNISSSSISTTLDILEYENEKLISEVSDLKKVVEMFRNGKQSFTMVLGK